MFRINGKNNAQNNLNPDLLRYGRIIQGTYNRHCVSIEYFSNLMELQITVFSMVDYSVSFRNDSYIVTRIINDYHINEHKQIIQSGVISEESLLELSNYLVSFSKNLLGEKFINEAIAQY